MPCIQQAFALDIGDERQTQQLAFGGISANAMKKIFRNLDRSEICGTYSLKNEFYPVDEVYAFATKFEHKALAVRRELCQFVPLQACFSDKLHIRPL